MLPEHEWLAQAKRLAVGMKSRIKHRNEKRINLVIGNDPDKYWAYCQRCHEGGVVKKDHVLLGDYDPIIPVELGTPDDMKMVRFSEYEVPVARFLATKNMALTYMPQDLRVSPSQRRLIVPCSTHNDCFYHGRDLTGRSDRKWLNYNSQQIVLAPTYQQRKRVVVVEDLFSMFKVNWAAHNSNIPVNVVCALGTAIKGSLVVQLMEFDNVIWFFDADPAGTDGALNGMRRMRVWNRQRFIKPPAGCDPKDMDCKDIVSLIKGVM